MELLNIVNEVAALKRLSIAQLRQRFAKLFGEATAASNRTWLVKRIIVASWLQPWQPRPPQRTRPRHAGPGSDFSPYAFRPIWRRKL
jgi:hypothetical protein